MPDILHRFTIDAPHERVHELIATREGVERWWTAHPNLGDETRLQVFFGGGDPAAVMDVEQTPERIVWRVVDGPADWVGTTITFELQRRTDDGTTLLFTHGEWREANEFMHGCSSNWGAYLTSLKSGAERGQFAAYPAGEMSRWS
ncbi:MAG: SRPBCC family protein [Solirubrobacteraceae bacterium]